MYYRTTYPTPVGEVTLACDGGQNLVGLWIEGAKYHGGNLSQAMIENNDMPIFNTVKRWLDRYFDGGRPDIAELSLAPVGSEFRQGVWSVLREIPYGEVWSYGEIAKKMADKMGRESMSSQAIGGAVGHNPISIIIPCHRVVGSQGSLTGFASGLQTKIRLLELEGLDMSRFFVPKKGSAL